MYDINIGVVLLQYWAVPETEPESRTGRFLTYPEKTGTSRNPPRGTG